MTASFPGNYNPNVFKNEYFVLRTDRDIFEAQNLKNDLNLRNAALREHCESRS